MKNAQDNLIIFSLLSFFPIHFQSISNVFQTCNFVYACEIFLANDTSESLHYKFPKKKTAEAAFLHNIQLMNLL